MCKPGACSVHLKRTGFSFLCEEVTDIIKKMEDINRNTVEQRM
jgi:hypothetical protein